MEGLTNLVFEVGTQRVLAQDERLLHRVGSEEVPRCAPAQVDDGTGRGRRAGPAEQ